MADGWGGRTDRSRPADRSRRRRTVEFDRAVSDVVGFVLVFSLVLSTVVMVYAMGFPALEQRRDAERVANAERAFDVLADNLGDVVERGAPARATEIKLADATLRATDGTRLTVNLTNVENATYSTGVSPIVYTAGGGTSIVYEAGAILRVQNDGAVMLRRPGTLFVDADGTRTAVVPMVQTRGDGETSVGGSTTVRVRAELAVAEVMTARNASAGPYDVNFTVTTTPDRADVWERYLDEEIAAAYGVTDPCSVTGGRVTCIFDVDRIYVTVTRMDVSFD